MGGSIFPGISTVFRYPPIKIDIPKIPLKGVIDYTIEYSSVPKDTCYTSHKKIEILVDNVQTKWTFLEENETVTVPQGNFFVFGDNRSYSSDSREWGLVPKKNIIGTSFFVYWPLSSAGVLQNPY